MNITSDRTHMIFRRDNEYGTFYSVGLSKKDKDGGYIKGYKEVKFQRGKGVLDKTKIKIKQAWIDFYIKDNVTKDYIFINDFEVVKDEEVRVDTTDSELPF